MIVCTYSLPLRIIYGFGNFFVTIFLLLHMIPMAFYLDMYLILILPFLLALFLIYYVNKAYLEMYKILPLRIEADEDKIVCSNFLFRKKTITIFYKDIENLSGGIFEGKFRGTMKVFDGKKRLYIGFYDRMKNSNKLVTYILSKVERKIYDEVIGNLQSAHSKTKIKK